MRTLRDLGFRFLFAALVPLNWTVSASFLQAVPPSPTFAASDTSVLTVAVLNFKNNSGQFHLEGLEKSVPEMLKTELSQSGTRIQVVEREKLESILQEQALGQTGAIDEKAAQTVGQLAGAEYLLIGEINTIADQRLRLDCHILKVMTGQVRGEKVIGRGREVIDDMVRLLAANILYNLTAEGRYSPSQRVKNYPTTWFLLGTGLTAAAGVAAHVISNDAYEQYQAATSLPEFDKYYNRASDFRTARNVLALVSGALAVASLNFWLKSHAADNQILAAQTPRDSRRAPRMTFFAGYQHGTCVGMLLHF